MYIVHVRFSIKPEFVDTFRDLVIKHANNSLTNEEGCQQFDVSFDPDDVTSCMLYEVYDDRAAFDVHAATPYLAAFGAAIEDGVVSKNLTFWNRVLPA